jgi:hypothetical protein
MGAVPRFENGWVLGPWGFDSPSFLSLDLEAWPSWKGSALLARRRREPLAGSSPAASVHRPVAQWSRAVGLDPTRARSNRAGASIHCDVVQR